MNCRGCGVEVDPSEEQVNAAVDEILETSLKDAETTGGVCPLCGHSKHVPYSQRKSVLFLLFSVCLLVLGVTAFTFWQRRQTERAAVVLVAVKRMSSNQDVVRLIGTPLTAEPGVVGDVRQDETGWWEAKLTVPVRGPKGKAQVHVTGGRVTEVWIFTTFEVIFEEEHKKLDLISGRIVEYSPNAYVDVHTQAAGPPEYTNASVPAAHLDGTFPCVFASVTVSNPIPQFGKCEMPTPGDRPEDRFEADFRDGSFALRETDLRVKDVFDVPLTRSYRSYEWAHPIPVHAFGRNSNHPYDIAPVGSRNPYTYLMIVLEDGEFLYFDRISKGTGYADAVYMHTETSTPFYKATIGWNGNGWTTKLADGSQILFPESYSAKNMAQGAPVEMRDAKGNRLELNRDPQRNLQEIRTPHNHWIKFVYDELSRIKRAVNDAGEWAEYQYNSDGMLTTVTLSSGRQRHYQYEGALMTQISDETGKVLLHNWYASGFLSRQKFANGAVFSYSYEWGPHKHYPELVKITLPDQTTQAVTVEGSITDYVRHF